MYDKASSFTSFINKGGLQIPSPFTLKVVASAEQVFKCYVSSGNQTKNSGDTRKLKTKMLQEFSHKFAENGIEQESDG